MNGKSLMKVLVFLLYLLIPLNTLLAEIKPFAIEGYLGGNIHFRLDLACESNDGLVWGETTYFRKNGNNAKIKVVGSIIEKKTIDGDCYNEYYLTEFSNKKVCGHFSFNVNANNIENGSWFLKDKKLSFRNTKTMPFHGIINKRPETNDENYLEAYHPINYKCELKTNDEIKSTYMIEIDDALLIPRICSDSIRKWIKTELGVSRGFSYLDIEEDYITKCIWKDKETQELVTTFNIVSISENYITYDYYVAHYYHGLMHPTPFFHITNTFDINTGKILKWNDIFTTPINAAIERIIDSEMRGQNDISDLSDDDLICPDYGPYIINGMIGFHYNAYETGAWSDGIPECKIDPSKLKNYLTDKAKDFLGL